MADLTQKQVNELCRPGKQDETCAFLGMADGKWLCTKGTDMEPIIMERLEAGSMTAKGDNCSGPPNFSPTEKVG